MLKLFKLILILFLAGLTLSSCQAINPDLGGGKILLYTTDGNYIDSANVGYLPDMVTFIDEHSLISANEGEPSDDYQMDPEGSVSIIQLTSNKAVKKVTTLGFTDVELVGDVRIKPASSVAQDLEPEFVAVNENGTKAWVSLQENNAVAIVNLEKESIDTVKSLGAVQWSGIEVDISDDGKAKPVSTAPENIFALFQPDTLVAYQVDGKDYLVSANEGDDREYDAWEDLAKANDLELPNGQSALSPQLQKGLLDSKMKKLRVLKDLGKDSTGVYQTLTMTGTRSFSIWDEDANRVFDSTMTIESILASDYANVFNTRVDDTDDPKDIAELKADGIAYSMIDDTAYFWEGVDARSLKKGAEPEALALAKIDNKTFAYLGLEKQGGIMVFNITNPTDVSFVQYFNDIDYNALPAKAGDLAPEGTVTFMQNNNHYLAVANELSSTVSLYSLASTGIMYKLASLQVGTFGEGAAEIVDYDSQTQSLFLTNGEKKRVDIIDVSRPTTPTLIGNIDFSEYSDSLQSVAVNDGIVAIAVE